MLLALLGLPAFSGQALGIGQETLFEAKKAAPGTPAADFSLEDLSGASVGLKDYRGKAVLIHFWASWCEPCKEEFPALKRLWERFRDRGLVVLAVAEDSRERAGEFSKAHGADFPVLIDRYGAVMRSYGVKVVPVSMLVNRDGLVEAAFIGPRDYDSPQARRYFEGMLK